MLHRSSIQCPQERRSSSEGGQLSYQGLKVRDKGSVLEKRVPDAADRGVASQVFGVISCP